MEHGVGHLTTSWSMEYDLWEQKVRYLEVSELGVCHIAIFGGVWGQKYRYFGAVCIAKTQLQHSKYWVMVPHRHFGIMVPKSWIWGAMLVRMFPSKLPFWPRARRSKTSWSME